MFLGPGMQLFCCGTGVGDTISSVTTPVTVSKTQTHTILVTRILKIDYSKLEGHLKKKKQAKTSNTTYEIRQEIGNREIII